MDYVLHPLHEAAKVGDLNEVTRLLDAGVYVNHRDNYGNTALYMASCYGHLEIVTLLLDRGASIDIQENAGWTALMVASLNGKANVVSLLLERGANPSIKDKSGKTALDNAKQKNNLDCAAILVYLPIKLRQQQQEEEERRNREREVQEMSENDAMDRTITNQSTRFQNFHPIQWMDKKIDFDSTSQWFTDRMIGVHGAFYLAGRLADYHNLLTLDLSRNNIEDQGCIAVAEALINNTTVTSLNLVYNNIGLQGGMALVEMLKRNKMITELYLDRNNLGAQVAVEILANSQRLITLSLGYNNIGTQGGTSIAVILEVNVTLKYLNLNGNNMGIEAALSFAQALQRNHTLTHLRLADNPIGNRGKFAIVGAIQSTQQLTLKDLDGVDLKESSIRDLLNLPSGCSSMDNKDILNYLSEQRCSHETPPSNCPAIILPSEPLSSQSGTGRWDSWDVDKMFSPPSDVLLLPDSYISILSIFSNDLYVILSLPLPSSSSKNSQLNQDTVIKIDLQNFKAMIHSNLIDFRIGSHSSLKAVEIDQLHIHELENELKSVESDQVKKFRDIILLQIANMKDRRIVDLQSSLLFGLLLQRKLVLIKENGRIVAPIAEKDNQNNSHYACQGVVGFIENFEHPPEEVPDLSYFCKLKTECGKPVCSLLGFLLRELNNLPLKDSLGDHFRLKSYASVMNKLFYRGKQLSDLYATTSTTLDELDQILRKIESSGGVFVASNSNGNGCVVFRYYRILQVTLDSTMANPKTILFPVYYEIVYRTASTKISHEEYELARLHCNLSGEQKIELEQHEFTIEYPVDERTGSILDFGIQTAVVTDFYLE